MAKERRIFGGRNNAAPSDEARNFSTPGFRGRGQATYEQTVAPPLIDPYTPEFSPTHIPTFLSQYLLHPPPAWGPEILLPLYKSPSGLIVRSPFYRDSKQLDASSVLILNGFENPRLVSVSLYCSRLSSDRYDAATPTNSRRNLTFSTLCYYGINILPSNPTPVTISLDDRQRANRQSQARPSIVSSFRFWSPAHVSICPTVISWPALQRERFHG